MGTYCTAYRNNIIPIEKVEDEWAKEECDVLFKFLSDNDYLVTDFIAYYELGDDLMSEADFNKANKLYKALQDKVKSISGLNVEVNHHNAETRGDEVNCRFWIVTNATIPNPALSKEVTKHIINVGYVECG